MTYATQGDNPLVIVGAGPVGVRAAVELRRALPGAPIVLYGDEPWHPYNRVRLSSLLAGDAAWADFTAGLALPDRIETRFGCRVAAIDPLAQCVTDEAGVVQPYATLVLATGSRAHIPDIPGIALAGVFCFRALADAEALQARLARCRRVVVVGGGLLGLETARALHRYRTEVVVVEHHPRLMPNQLDQAASERLCSHVRASGVEVVLDDGPMAILGDGRVTGVRLRSGRVVACDTVVLSTGIRPNIELARDAGLAFQRGILVNDRMQASAAGIYAVGECAQHRGLVHGLVAPGFEQAAVAARVIAGEPAQYLGSLSATRLKVANWPVFSMGEVGAWEPPDLARAHVHASGGCFRKLVIRRGRLVGALALGEWRELARVQEAVQQQRRIWPWQTVRFRSGGEIWGETVESVAAWPAEATVCNCTGVTRGVLSGAISGGCSSVAALTAQTGACSVCGSCRPLLDNLIGASSPREPIPLARRLLALSAWAMLLATLFVLPANLPYASTEEIAWHWDDLWRDGVIKQISGYSLLALAALLALIGLRKRWKRLNLLAFVHWRWLHALAGGVALTVLWSHTGGRMGDGLNQWLSLAMLGASLSGGALALFLTREHRVAPAQASALRPTLQWMHTLLLWPLPVLLGFHIFKVYYY
ncbi:FAD-dependent oxidoreductase [Thiobacillus sp.]|uniref:FAD-dependent oxidoreductase n=1 Tax=Thiobacillus sp. TaxID=924 RepID=UPI0011D781E4|nr:FAD-dependent oxidoreductase [Thiobacillus sp.]TXH75792.1 MAG: NAD(P)/FAD-dependent oxidoreductase [Thiobacillus sp.]